MQVDGEAESTRASVGELQAWMAHAWNVNLCQLGGFAVFEGFRVEVECNSVCSLRIDECACIFSSVVSQKGLTPFLTFWCSIHLKAIRPTLSPSM